VEVIIDLPPVKRGDPGCPVIPISIGMVDFPEALCDFGSSINIMPRFPKGNIEEPLRLSWYLIHSSTLHGDRDWY